MFRTFLIRFLLVCLLEIILLVLLYFHFQGIQRSKKLLEEEQNLEFSREIVARDFISLLELIYLVSDDPLFLRYLDNPTSDNMQILKEHLAIITCRNYHFSRFSLLDEEGRELAASRLTDDGGEAVPSEDLRAFGETLWFRDILAMEEPSLYLSPLKSRLDFGEAEGAGSGHFRMGLPVAGRDSGRFCYLVIEYDYGRLLALFREEFNMDSRNAYFLINRTGEYLAVSDPGPEGVVSRTSGSGFKRDYPEVWTRIRFGETGRIITHEGAFLYSAGLLGQSVAGMAPEMKGLKTRLTGLTGAMIIRLPEGSLRFPLFNVFPPIAVLAVFLVPIIFTLIAWRLICNGTYMKYLGTTLDIFFRGIEKNPTSIFLTDRNGTIQYVNPKFLEITGFREEEVLGDNPRLLKSGAMEDEVYSRLWQTISEGENWQGELLNRNKKGHLYWVSASISPIRDRKGRITHFLGIQEDISEIKQYQEHLKMLASEDPLTGLLNRRSFQMMLEKELERCSRYGRTVSVVMMDIDDFKRVNDTRRHQAGDEVLRKLGALLTDAVRSIDIPGRYGGEEFILALPETGLEEAVKIAERIRAAAEKMPVDWEERPIRFTLSLGVAAIPPERNAEECIARADTCLYEAKERGKNRVCSP